MLELIRLVSLLKELKYYFSNKLLNDSIVAAKTLIPEWYKNFSLFPNPTKDLLYVRGDIYKLKSIDLHKFTISFSDIEYGPNNHNPRLIWVKGNIPKKLLQLTNELNKIFFCFIFSIKTCSLKPF